MPNVRSRRRRPRRTARALPQQLAIAPAPVEEKPVRGVKLKTVSSLTLAFALLCVAAFAAGRPPASTAGPAAVHGIKEAAHVARTANRTSAVESTHPSRRAAGF
jgi:hypothetical protein